MIHVSEVLDLPVVDSAQQRVGRIDDLIVDSGEAAVQRLVVRARGALAGEVVVNAGRRSRAARIQAR